MRVHLPKLNRRRGRSGVAPLEFVLTLPVLLFTMALIINFGNVAAWKVRSSSVARQAVWRERHPRSGANDPRPAGWPQGAALSNVSDNLGSPIAGDPFAQHTVTRGPTLAPPTMNSNNNSIFFVNPNLLDLRLEARRGRADIQMAPPLMPQLGDFAFHIGHPLFDAGQGGLWRYGDMNTGNNSRRTLVTYTYLPDGTISQLGEQFRTAAMAILTSPIKQYLDPLDRDDEFIAEYGSAPDFHPNIGNGCSLDVDQIRQSKLTNRSGLIDRIQGPMGGGRNGVPDRMAGAWISLYQRKVNTAMAQMPPDTGTAQYYQNLIDQLQKFRGTLN